MQELEERVPSIFIVPLILFFVGLLLFVALLNGQRNLALLTVLIFVMVAGAKIWARLSLSGIRCYMDADKKKVFPDEKLTLKIKAENQKFLPVWLQMKVPVDGSLDPLSHQSLLSQLSSYYFCPWNPFSGIYPFLWTFP